MARARSLSALIADVRQRANMEGSTFVSDAELTEYINQEIAELRNRIALNEGQGHQLAAAPIAITTGTALYSLPDNFWEIRNVEAVINGSTVQLHPFMAAEHASLINAASNGYVGRPMYRLAGDNIEFCPANQNFTATLYYIPSSLRLSLGTDTVDGYNGYEMAVIYGVVATMLMKQEEDPSFFIGQKDRILAQIDVMVARRDAGSPERVQDVVGDTPWWMP